MFKYNETKINLIFGAVSTPYAPLIVVRNVLLTCTVLRFVGAIGTVAVAVAVFDGRHAPNGGGGV